MKVLVSAIRSGLGRRNRWRFGADGLNPYHVLTDKPPRNLPEGFWHSISRLKMFLRVTSVLWIVAVCLTFGDLLFPQLLTIASLRRYSLLCLALVVVLHACVGTFCLRIAFGRFERFLIEHSWFVCIRCGYVLEGLPDHHRCPECNCEYERSLLENKWRSWVDRSIVYSAKELNREDLGSERA